jgi:hypothetical protein
MSPRVIDSLSGPEDDDDDDEMSSVSGLVQMGATAADHADAKKLVDELVAEIRRRTGWDDATVRSLVSHSYTPAEASHLAVKHAAAAKAGMHGLVELGRKKGPFDFLSQFDPTWPKAKFGGIVRQALVIAGGAIGIPVGPILDQVSGMAQTFQNHPVAAAPGPLPPMPHPAPGLVLPIGPPKPHKKKWSTGEKVAVVGGVGLAAYLVYRLTMGRKPNPRRRRRNPSRRRHNARRRRR